MRRRLPYFTALLLFVVSLPAGAAEDVMDGIQNFLTFSAFDGAFRVHFSGLADLEDYQMERPPPALLYTASDNLVNARLSLFVDAELGRHIYGFAQASVDRGFDPTDRYAQVRMNEYAMRITPWEDGRFSLQVGKFATVAGNWVQRHLSWDNPFISAPVPYENLTGVWDVEAPDSPETLLFWAHVPNGGVSDFGDGYTDKRLRVPVIWGPSYASGVSVAGRIGKLDYAAEIKNASLSSRPDYWDLTARNFADPTFTGRLGFRPNAMWNLGFSVSSGAYLLPEAKITLPVGREVGDYQEQVLAQDLSFEWHHLQVWAEFFEARFEVPTVGNVETLAYYLETKYKITPQFFGALRWNQQLFDEITDSQGTRVPWGNDLWRIDAALGYRFTAYTQLKLQYSLQHEENAARDLSSLFAAQFTLRF
jgi:hypothetical protein